MKETITPDILIGGAQFPLSQMKISFEVGSYKRGELVEIDEVTNNIKKCTDVTKMYGIVVSDTEIEVKGVAEIYVTGVFNFNGMEIGVLDKEKIKIIGRKIGMFFSRT